MGYIWKYIVLVVLMLCALLINKKYRDSAFLNNKYVKTTAIVLGAVSVVIALLVLFTDTGIFQALA